MRKKLLILLAASFLLLSISGCWGKREIESLAFVVAIGLDFNTKTDSYQVTYQIAEPSKGGEGGPKIENRTITIESKSMVEVSSRSFEFLNKQNFPGAVKIIIIGKDLAERGMNESLDFYQRLYQLRRTVFLLLAEDKAQDILNVKMRNKDLPALSLLEIINNTSDWSITPLVRLGHYLTILGRKSEAPVIPLVRPVKPGEGGIIYKSQEEGEAEEIQLTGAGVFKGDRLAGQLTEDETKGYLWLQNEVKQRLLDTSDEGQPVYGGRVVKSGTKVKLETVDGVKGVRFLISADVSIDEYQCREEAVNPAEMKPVTHDAEEKFAQAIEKECEEAIAKSKELKLDFLGIGRQIEMKNSKYWKEIKESWPEMLPEMPVAVEAQVKVINTGATFQGPVNSESGGEE
ncbi:MAG: Ger(x)C family spore germination protein [Desulfitobacteriaceae bacterium]